MWGPGALGAEEPAGKLLERFGYRWSEIVRVDDDNIIYRNRNGKIHTAWIIHQDGMVVSLFNEAGMPATSPYERGLLFPPEDASAGKEEVSE